MILLGRGRYSKPLPWGPPSLVKAYMLERVHKYLPFAEGVGIAPFWFDGAFTTSEPLLSLYEVGKGGSYLQENFADVKNGELFQGGYNAYISMTYPRHVYMLKSCMASGAGKILEGEDPTDSTHTYFYTSNLTRVDYREDDSHSASYLNISSPGDVYPWDYFFWPGASNAMNFAIVDGASTFASGSSDADMNAGYLRAYVMRSAGTGHQCLGIGNFWYPSQGAVTSSEASSDDMVAFSEYFWALMEPPPYVFRSFYTGPVNLSLSAPVLATAVSLRGSLVRSINFSAAALSGEGDISGGAFISHSYSRTLEAEVTLANSLNIGVPFIETDGSLECGTELLNDGLLWSYSKDAGDELTALTELVGGAYHNVLVEGVLEAEAVLAAIAGVGFAKADCALEASTSITGSAAGHVHQEEVLSSETSLIAGVVVSIHIASDDLTAETSVEGSRTPLGSVNYSQGQEEAVTSIEGGPVLSVVQGGAIEAESAIEGSAKVEYSVIFRSPELEVRATLVNSLEVFQFKLRGNFRKTDAVSVLDLDLINIGGENAA